MGDTPNIATPEQNAPTAGLPPAEAGAPGATDIELQNPFRPQGPLDLASAIGRATTGSVPLPSAQGPQGQLSPEEQRQVAYDTRRLKAASQTAPQSATFDPNAPYQSVTKAGESLMFDPKAPYESVTIGGKAAPKAPPTPTEPQGPLDVLWDKVNKAIIPKEAIFGAMTGYTTEELQKALKADPGQPGPQVNIPGVGAFDLNTLATGTLESIAGTASQFTSPLSIGLLALGPLAGAAGKSAQALRLAKLAKAADGEVETYEIIQAGRTADLARATEQVGTLRDEAQAARAAVDAGTGTEEAAVTAENKLSEAIKNLTSSQEVTKEIGESLALKRVAAAQANRISIQALDVAKKVGVFGKIPEKAAPALQWLQKGAMFGIEAQMVPEIIKGQQEGETTDQMVERRLNALGWAMLGAEGLKGSPLDVPLKDVPNLFVKGAGKVADAAGSVRELVSSVAAKVKNPNMTLGDAMGSLLGKTADFDEAIKRIAPPSKKAYGEYTAKLKNVREPLQAILNNDPKTAESPKAFGDGITKYLQEKINAPLQREAGATKDSTEPVTADFEAGLRKRLDTFFDEDNPGKFGSDDDVAAAKRDIIDRVLRRGEQIGIDEKTGEAIYGKRAPNLYESENIRQGLNIDAKPQYNTNARPTTDAYKVGANQAANYIREQIDQAYDAKGVKNVAEARRQEADLYDIRDQILSAQAKAEAAGQPGFWNSMVAKIGAPSTIIAIALGHPIAAVPMVAGITADLIHQRKVNPNYNLGRASELAARNPNAKVVTPEFTTPPNAEGQVGPPMAPPPVASAAPEAFEPPSREFSPLHSKLASYLRKRVGDISYEEAEKDFLKAYDDHVQNNVPPEKMKREQVLFEQIQDVDAADALAKKKFEAKAAEEAAKAAEKAAAAAPKPKPAALPPEATHVLNPETGKIEPVRPKAQAPSSSKEAGAQEQAPAASSGFVFQPDTARTAGGGFTEAKGETFLENTAVGPEDMHRWVLTSEEQAKLDEVNKLPRREQTAASNALAKEIVESRQPDVLRRWKEGTKLGEPGEHISEPYKTPENPLNAETRAPFKTEPHQEFPEEWRDIFEAYGMSMPQTAYHEGAHHMGHAVNGFESWGTIGQEHPEAKRVGGIARADWNQTEFRYPETGYINKDAVKARIGDLLYQMYMGPVADELRFNIGMENNKGAAQDFKNVNKLLDIAEITDPKERAALKDAAIARAKGDLTVPGVHEILSKYTGEREAGIPKEMLMTPETVANMQKELLEARGQNEKRSREVGRVDERTARRLREGNGEGNAAGEGRIAQGALPATAAQARPLSAEAVAPAEKYHPDLQKLADAYHITSRPPKVGFIAPDGKFIDTGLDDHPEAIEKTTGKTYNEGDIEEYLVDQERPQSDNRVDFINRTGAARLRFRDTRGGKELAVSVPAQGVTFDQVEAIRRAVGQGLGRNGNLYLERSDVTPETKNELTTQKEFVKVSDVDGLLKKISAHPEEGALNQNLSYEAMKGMKEARESEDRAKLVNANPPTPTPPLNPAKIQGGEHATPAPTYHEASQVEGNPWVRKSADAARSAAPTNSGRQLMVQFSSDLINKGGPADTGGEYYDKLYSGARPGYARLKDFWEIPQWMGFVAHNLPDADVYVVRDMAQAKQFLNNAGYDRVLFSALDVNKNLIRELAKDYKGHIDVGGYVAPGTFLDTPNVKYHPSVESLATEVNGPGSYKNGTDYRHFEGSDVIPRLTMSDGCLHKCAFCVVKRELTITPEAVVDQQADSMSKLGAKLVYLNDKTFGQAPNYQHLADVYTKMKAANPDFKGFVVQTTAAQLTKIPSEWLGKSGIKYVELGVESYNDPILKEMHKPANEKLIDAATQKLREHGIALIPNILVGLPGETAETYAHTLDFLNRNKDIISHANIYNLAVYPDAELAKKLTTASEGDFNENVLEKSFHSDPKIHRQFAGDLYGTAQNMLEGRPESALDMFVKAPEANGIKRIEDLRPEDLQFEEGKRDWAHRAVESHRTTGGFTIHPETGMAPTKGHVIEVSPEHRQPVEGMLQPEDVEKFHKENKALFAANPELHVGGYGNQLNVSAVGTPEGARLVGNKLDQESGWDAEKHQVVPYEGKGEKKEFPDYPLAQRLAELKGTPEGGEGLPYGTAVNKEVAKPANLLRTKEDAANFLRDVMGSMRRAKYEMTGMGDLVKELTAPTSELTAAQTDAAYGAYQNGDITRGQLDGIVNGSREDVDMWKNRLIKAGQMLKEYSPEGLAAAFNRAKGTPENPLNAEVRVVKSLPSQPRLPDEGTFPAIKTDDGAIYYDSKPEGRTHIMFAKEMGIPPERIVSGGWLTNGEYEGSVRSDAGRWGEQARAKAAVEARRENPLNAEVRAPRIVDGQDVVEHLMKTAKIDENEAMGRTGTYGAGRYALIDVPIGKGAGHVEAGDDYNPALAKKYADKPTEIPAIVLGPDGDVRDGNHRIAAAEMRGEKTVKAYVPVGYPETEKMIAAHQSPAPVAAPEEGFAFGKNVEGTPDQQKGLVSTRVPSAAKSTENPIEKDLTIGREAIAQVPGMAEKMANLVREYPGVKIPENIKDPDKVLNRFVDHAKENLKALYNSVPPERREANMKWYDSANKLASNLAEKYGHSTKQAAGVIAAMSPQKDWDMNVGLAERVNDTFHTQKDTQTSPEMLAKGQEIINKTNWKNPLEAKANRNLAGVLSTIEGKTFGELTDPIEKAAWIRLHDEAHNSRQYHSIDPATGESRGLAVDDEGKPRRIAWGSLKEISKAISILEDGSRENISDKLGDAHKVRNFYNNILDPNNPTGHVTIDTHAVGAALMRPMSGKSPEVLQNFGGAGAPSSTINGVSGTYPLIADAYRLAAKDLGVQPRQLQSVVWEEIRNMFPAEMKRIPKHVDAVNDIWQQYGEGKISLDKAHDLVQTYAKQAAGEMATNRAAGKISAQQFLEKLGQGGLFALAGGKE